jgi:hypothetical protein
LPADNVTMADSTQGISTVKNGSCNRQQDARSTGTRLPELQRTVKTGTPGLAFFTLEEKLGLLLLRRRVELSTAGF